MADCKRQNVSVDTTAPMLLGTYLSRKKKNCTKWYTKSRTQAQGEETLRLCTAKVCLETVTVTEFKAQRINILAWVLWHQSPNKNLSSWKHILLQNKTKCFVPVDLGSQSFGKSYWHNTTSLHTEILNPISPQKRGEISAFPDNTRFNCLKECVIQFWRIIHDNQPTGVGVKKISSY